MAVNKIYIESHSNPMGFYQVRWRINGVTNGISDELLDMTLEQAIASAQNLANHLKSSRGIKVKEKNLIIDLKAVWRNASRDESSKRYLESNEKMVDSTLDAFETIKKYGY